MKWLLWGIFTWNRGRWTFTAPPGDDSQFTVFLKLRRFCSWAVNAWSCEWQPWEFSSVNRKAREQGRLSVSQLQHPGQDWRWGCPARCQCVCVAVGWSTHFCARLCRCVNAWMCLSVSPSAWCTGTMPCCFTVPSPPLSLLLVNLCPNPAAPRIHPTQQSSFFYFHSLVHLWQPSIIYCHTFFFFQSVYAFHWSFQVYWRSPFAPSCSVACSDRENVAHCSIAL